MREKSGSVSHGRRKFLKSLGIGAIVLTALATVGSYLRSLVPNILYEPLKKFKVGKPAQIPDGVQFFEQQREFVIRESGTIHAQTAICTHLGCTVAYVKLPSAKNVIIDGQEKHIEYEFHCPCHGSKFYADGTNYAGPAPRPLPWHDIRISPEDGQVLVDTGTEVSKGTTLNPQA